MKLANLAILAIMALLSTSPAHAEFMGPPYIPPKQVVYDVAYAEGFDADLLWAVAMTESSGCKKLFNVATRDYGCFQFNIKTIKALHLDLHRITYDHAYAAHQAISYIRNLQDQYKKRERLTYICRYNVGTGTLSGLRAKTCIKYANRIEHFRSKLNTILAEAP